MNLRTKTLLIIGTVFFSGLIVLLLIFSRILLADFTQLEDENVRADIQRVEDAIKVEIDTVVTKSSDWAVWDDTYAFMKDHNEEFIASNLKFTPLPNLKLSVMMFIDPQNKVVEELGYDLAQNSEVPVSESLHQKLRQEDSVFNHPDTSSVKSGIVLLPEGPLLVVTRPIVTSEGNGPIRGTLLFGRYLTSTELSVLSKVTNVSFEITQLDNREALVDFEVTRRVAGQGEGAVVLPTDNSYIAGYLVVNDIYGQPGILIKTNSFRKIYQQGLVTVGYFVAALIFVGLVVCIAVLMLLERWVLSPVTKLEQDVAELGKQGSLSARIPVSTASYELTQLANSINTMLSSLEDYQDRLQVEKDKAQQYIDILGVIILVINSDQTVISINRKGCEELGYEEYEVVGKNWFDSFVPIKVREEIREKCLQMINASSASTEYFEYPVITKNNEEQPIAWHIHVVRNKRGVVVELICSGQKVIKGN